MGSEPKEMKYRRRGRAPQPGEYGQCSDDRSGAVDWGALKQDPAALLRKLDEIRDHLTRSCEIAGPPPPAERHRMSRRVTSTRPSHGEPPLPPPPGRAPEYHRSRYTDHYGHGFPPSSYDQSSQRSLGDDRYPRQPSGRFRQWENYDRHGQGSCHQSNCRCAQCVHGHGQRTVAQEENIPMARYFAGQQGSYQFQRSSSISSEYDRRSVVSSLYAHLSMSKRRVEYFRKKAESFCRPVKGAAPFIVCSSCNQLLQLPPTGKCTPWKQQDQVRCGSCSEVVTFKLKEMKVHPLNPSSSFHVPKSVRSFTCRAPQSLQWYPQQDDDSSSFSKLRPFDSQQQDKDFSGNLSQCSTASYGSSNKERWSNKSIQFKSVSASRSRFADSPKDILCQGDADSQVKASALCTISPEAPVLEDKLVDCSGGDQIRRKNYGLNTKADYDAAVRSERIVVKCEQKSKEGRKDGYGEETSKDGEETTGKVYEQKECSDGDKFGSKKYGLNSKQENGANVRGERIDMKCEQKCKEGHKDTFGEETINIAYEQKFKQGSAVCHEDQSMASEYKQKARMGDSRSPLQEEEVMGNNYEGKSKQDHGSFEAQVIDMSQDKCNTEDYKNALDAGGISKRCEEENIEDDYGKSMFSNYENTKTVAKNESSVNGRSNTSSHVSSDADLDELRSLAVKSGDSSFFAGFLKKGFKDLSLFNQSAESVKVSVNGHPISDRALRKAEKKAGPVRPGSYWYDHRAGFWGVMGHECSGIIPPFIKEFCYSMPKDCADGNTGVFVNGRELHQKDFDLLVKRGLPRISGKSYSVEITGNVRDDTSGQKLNNLGKLAPTIEKMKRGFGMHVPEELS